jgi:cytoskeletal protein CcmA (bactofilin family)
MRIDGSVEGEIVAPESLWIGAEARVRGRVQATEVVIEGEVDGEIRAPGRIELRETARVRATLHTGCFVLADGAHFEGRCHTLPNGTVPGPPAAAGSNSPD